MSRAVWFLLISLLLVPSFAAADQASGRRPCPAVKRCQDKAKDTKDAKGAKDAKASQDKGGSSAEKALQESKEEKENKQPLSSVKQAATGLLSGKFGIQILEDYTHSPRGSGCQTCR